MVMIGSARHDERGGYSGGMKGDSIQTAIPDKKGEVSMQIFYVHSKGWNIIRAKDPSVAVKLAAKMKQACNNRNIGYSQSDRYSIIKYGTATTQKCNADCSSLVRVCVKEATGIDPGDFTTVNAVTKLNGTKLFQGVMPYTSSTVLCTGDILCTKTKGHIVIVTDGSEPEEEKPINGNPYKEPAKNVRLNTRGNDARWLQYELNRCGYKLVVDGIAGLKTIGALADFQSKNDLSADGICGPKTIKALLS